MNRLLLIILVLIAQAIPATAESREKDLDRWVDRELIPHVKHQLLTHPRFKGETVMFVVLKDNAPTPASNELAISLRDRVLDAAVNTPGVSVGWQHGGGAATAGTIDCTRDNVHYYIGLELAQELDSSYSVSVRALDLEDRSWVAGFGKRWQGQLRAIHRQAMRQSRIDATFLGSREVPFSLAQTDLLAASLAHDLSCALLKETDGEYLVVADLAAGDGASLDSTVELAGNNLAGHAAIELTEDDELGNAVLRGKAHRIDGSLFQYWLTVTPARDDAGLSTLSASAYVLMPGYGIDTEDTIDATRPPAIDAAAALGNTAPARRSVSIPNAGQEALLGPLRIAVPADVSQCGNRDGAGHATFRRASSVCSLLVTEPQSDAIVFFIGYQANHGLVRFGGGECRDRTAASVARSGRDMRFPIPRTIAGGGSKETYDWLLEPDLDTYYAIAMTDARAARGIANHIDRLPLRCSDAVRPGLKGTELQAWLNEFAYLAARSSQHFDWRALQVKDVF
jgi:hypothetical protein